MNDNTLVAICGYQGDAHQIRNALPYYFHHKCPVVVCSPDDSPINAQLLGGSFKGLDYRFGGKRAYVGQMSLDREVEHLKILLTYPQNFFLVHDSDSVCLSPRIPDYLYHTDCLWSNQVSDLCHQRPDTYTLPRLAFQPPYFMTRRVIQGLIDAAPQVPTEQQTPFIDWCLMAWCMKAGLPSQTFPDGVSCPSWTPESLAAMSNAVRNEGRIFVHSIKHLDVLRKIAFDRVHYKRSHGIR